MTQDVKSQTSSTPESHIPSIARLKPEHTVEWEEIIAANTKRMGTAVRGWFSPPDGRI